MAKPKVAISARLEAIVQAPPKQAPGGANPGKQVIFDPYEEAHDFPIAEYRLKEKAKVINELAADEKLVLGLMKTADGYELQRDKTELPLDTDTKSSLTQTQPTFKVRFAKANGSAAKRAVVSAAYPVTVKPSADLRATIVSAPEWMYLMTVARESDGKPVYRLFNTQKKDGGGAQPGGGGGSASDCYNRETFEERLKCLLEAG